MMSKPAVALYLGESYASIGLFNTSEKNNSAPVFEKSVFLPQGSLKTLLHQVRAQLQEHGCGPDTAVPVYVVTKYFDRLKQFRLGGSISQVILKGFENSYTLADSRSLSLAASQLIIALSPGEIRSEILQSELARVRKINPDLNKAVISLPEDKVSSSDLELIYNFFSEAGLKIFTCPAAGNQSFLRKTLLNAGSEGTKEEIVTDIREIIGAGAQVRFFCRDGFETEFENCELFSSAGNFLSHSVKNRGYACGAYFDIETIRFVSLHLVDSWKSPWGEIPGRSYMQSDLAAHPFTEVKLNHLSVLDIEPTTALQLEPGPVIAGRAIKPLVIDLFYHELPANGLAMNLFPQLPQDNLRAKLGNLFSVLEKGQKNPVLAVSAAELRKNFLEALNNEVGFHAGAEMPLLFGPLADVFADAASPGLSRDKFSWPAEIMTMAEVLR